MGAQGTALGSANMWALLLDKDPGHSAAAGDLAVDVVDRKLKKAEAVKVEKAPLSGNVAKPANRAGNANKNRKGAAVESIMQAAASKRAHGDRSKKMKKVAPECSKQATASADIVDGGGKVKINGAAGDNKQAAPVLGEELTNMRVCRYLSEETSKKEEEEFAVVAARGGRGRGVAPRARKAAVAQDVAVTGSNMWALLSLSDEDTNHGDTTFVDEVEEAPPADNVDGSVVGVRSDPGGGAYPAKRGKKTKTKKQKSLTRRCELEEDEEEMASEVAIGGSRCRTVASRLCRAAVAVALLAGPWAHGSWACIAKCYLSPTQAGHGIVLHAT